jgi:hypothetical protein
MDSESEIQKDLWEYFTKSSKGTALCNICKKKLRNAGGSTSGLHYHLNSQHKINLRKRTPPDQVATTSTTIKNQKIAENNNSIQHYFKATIDEFSSCNHFENGCKRWFTILKIL